jgi:NAD(P)-dependent dehydrogenase (short-subunit alcohol dehydrogenase family)
MSGSSWTAGNVPAQDGRVAVITGANSAIGYEAAAVLAAHPGADVTVEQRGNPKLVHSSSQSHDRDVQQRLWSVSEELTGVSFPV